jgi:hypothetical protein
MFVRWNERPIPMRQRSWGAIPVTSASRNTTRPPSGQVTGDQVEERGLAGAVGPMMALIEPFGTVKLTPPTAWKPSKLLRTSRRQALGVSRHAAATGVSAAPGQPAREHEEEDTRMRAQDRAASTRCRR